MFARSILRKALALPFEQTPSSTTLFRATLTTTTSTSMSTQSPNPESPLSTSSRAQFNDPTHQQHQPSVTPSAANTSAPASTPYTTPQTSGHIPTHKQPLPPTFESPLKVTSSLLELLPHLTAQRAHYITAHVHAKPYLVTAGDHLRLPFLMANVQPGDVIRLNRASVIGSRDFTLKGKPYIDERMFECRARVVGVDSEPMRYKEKTKRRQRHVRTIKSKERYTMLRIMDLRVKTKEELVQEGAVVVEGQDQAMLEVKS